MNINNKHNFSKNFALFSLVNFFSYLLLYIVIIAIVFNILDYDSCVVYCDSTNDSFNHFFVDSASDKSFQDSNVSNDVNCSNILDKYKSVGKRHVSWYIFEKGKGNYANYEEYKKSWNPDMNILSEIRKQVRLDIDNSLHKLKVNKRSLYWFFKGSKPSGGRF
jgi:hypothetical protein